MSGHTPERCSDDRLSLAHEIAETLKSRGHWVPADFAGPDLITAVARAVVPKGITPDAVPDLVRFVGFVSDAFRMLAEGVHDADEKACFTQMADAANAVLARAQTKEVQG